MSLMTPTPMDSQALIEGLNDRQREAVVLPDVSAIVLAGAGSGKTKVLTTRVAYLLNEGRAQENSVLAVTFTNKAANEMKIRLHRMSGRDARRMWIGTFHGLCNRILRENYRDAGLPASFSIMDESDQLSMIKRVMEQVNIDKDEFPANRLQGFINKRKELGERPWQVEVLTDDDKLMTEFYAAYEARCDREGVIDFSELLLRVLDVFKRTPAVLDKYRGRFTHILVDEFQDTNPLQYEWLRLLKSEDATIFAVGDDDQSIYGFRNANPANMQDFVKNIAHDRVIRLEQNYRSTGSILEAANKLIEINKGRLGKNLWTEAGHGQKMRAHQFETDLDESDYVASEIKRLIGSGVSPSDIAILYRTNAQSRGYEKSLIAKGVPYVVYGGTRFYERMEVKNALAYMRLTTNLSDDGAFTRIVNFPPRGIGDKSVEAIQEIAHNEGIPMLEAAATRYEGGAQEKVSVFVALLTELFNAITEKPLPEFIDFVLKKTGLIEQYSKKKDDEDRVNNLREMVTAAAQFCAESATPDASKRPAIEMIDEFLATATLESAVDSGQDNESSHGVYNPKAVTLMTVHSAKGLEFDAVFLGGMEDGLFPNDMALDEGNEEEERRLMYVAITRARKLLVTSYAKNRMLYGKPMERPVSRFITEVPADLIEIVKHKPQPRGFQGGRPQGTWSGNQGGARKPG